MEQRRGRLRALGAEVPRVAAAALGRRGFATARLVADWSAIVGAEWAEKTAPDRLAFPAGERSDGTLRLRVAPGCGPEVQHRAPLLIERVNGFFGYRAVARLALIQGPLPAPVRRPPPALRPLGPAEAQALDARLAGVADPGLRAALRRLGAAVLGSDLA